MKIDLNQKNEWITLPPNSEEGMYIDPTHKRILDTAKEVITKNWDMIFVYDGYEGSGKSVKAMQDALYCDPTFNLDRVVFNPTAFKEGILKAQKKQAVVYDEAYGGLSSRGAMGAINKSIVQMLTTIRMKNLFVFIVLPSFFDLDRYVAIWRSRALINIYIGDSFKRGFFKFYDIDKKKKLYVEGKKLYNYRCVAPNYSARFTDTWVVDQEEYEKKKISTSITTEETNRTFVLTITRKIKQEIVQNIKQKELGLTQKQIANIIGVTTMTIHNYLNKYQENPDIEVK